MRYKNTEGNAVTLHVQGKKIIKPGRLKGLLHEMKLDVKIFFDFIGVKV